MKINLKLTYSKAMVFATIMAASIVLPILICIPFALAVMEVSTFAVYGSAVLIAVAAAIILPKQMDEFAEMYR